MINQGTPGQFAAIEQATPKPQLGIQDHTTPGDPQRLARRSRSRREAAEERQRARERTPLAWFGWCMLRLVFPPLLIGDLLARALRRRRATQRSHGLPPAVPPEQAAPRGRLARDRDRALTLRHLRWMRGLKLGLYAFCVVPLAGYLVHAVRHGADALVPGVRGGSMRVVSWIVVYASALGVLLVYELANALHRRRREVASPRLPPTARR